MQIVNADFKAILREISPHVRRSVVLSFRHKVECGPKSKLHFEIGQFPATLKPDEPLNIMGKGKREALPIRPARPICRNCTGARMDWPGSENSLLQRNSIEVPKRESE